MMYKACPNCHERFVASGLPAHMRGRRCEANQNKIRMWERGFVEASSIWFALDLLRNVGVPVLVGKTRYFKGGIHRRGGIGEAFFVPAWIVTLYNNQSYDYDVTAQEIRECLMNPKKRIAYVTEYLLGTRPLFVDALRYWLNPDAVAG